MEAPRIQIDDTKSEPVPVERATLQPTQEKLPAMPGSSRVRKQPKRRQAKQSKPKPAVQPKEQLQPVEEVKESKEVPEPVIESEVTPAPVSEPPVPTNNPYAGVSAPKRGRPVGSRNKPAVPLDRVRAMMDEQRGEFEKRILALETQFQERSRAPIGPSIVRGMGGKFSFQ